jgi:2-methylcitrate dehydratase PrpD
MAGKFSLEYATAAALVGPPEGPLPFTEDWVRRDDIQKLMGLVEFVPSGEGSGLLDGEHEVTITVRDGRVFSARGTTPPGAPESPAGATELALKLHECCGDLASTVAASDWPEASAILRNAVARRGLRALATA